MSGFKKIRGLLDSLTAEGIIPGCELSVYYHGENVFRGCYGYDDEKLERKTSRNTVYTLYSMTKAVTTCAIMKLIEEGKLGLDDPVSKYLPEYGEMKVIRDGELLPCRRKMTLRHVLSMQGGLDYDVCSPYITGENKRRSGRATTRQIVRAISEKPLLFEPGTDYLYSLCLDVAAAVAEEAIGVRFRDYVKDLIIRPLGIADMAYHREEISDPSRIAFEWDAHFTFDEKPTPCEVNHYGNYVPSPEYDSGGAGLVGTCDAYMKFAGAVVRGEILDKRTVAMWHENRLCEKALATYRAGKPEYGYGLGVRIFTDERRPALMNEFGWDGAAGSYVMMDEVNEIAAVYTQSVLACPQAFRDVHPVVRDCVYKELLNAD